MAKVKYIKIPVDFFDQPEIIEIEQMPNGDGILILYLHMICAAYRKGSKGIFEIAKIPLTDEVLHNVFDCEDIGEKLAVLQDHGLIERFDRSIHVVKFWQDKHDRNSFQYKEWRANVFLRDGFRCRKCGKREDIQAHHIKPWKDHKSLRYEVTNGITLCRSCHLEAHGGDWRG